MEPAVLVRYSEVAVKGRPTRRRMERLLGEALQEALRRRGLSYTSMDTPEGRIVIWGPSEPREVAKAAARVFGVKSTSPAVAFRFSSLEELIDAAARFFAPRARGRVFRVRARRAGTHPFTSKDIERLLGEKLIQLGAGPVNLSSPDYTAYVEVRGGIAFLFDEIIPGPGGLPLGSEDPVLVLYSGGFDSTVAAWLIMRRGAPAGLAFYDLGVEEAWETALRAARELAREWVHLGTLRLYRIYFREVMSRLASSVDPGYRLLVLRRLMMEHACRLALERGYEALATGESVGQVASQTVRNIRLIGSMLCLPVLRPLAGSDKDEVQRLAAEIGVYDIVKSQVEACRGSPVPRASPRRFAAELEKAKRALGDLLYKAPVEEHVLSAGMRE